MMEIDNSSLIVDKLEKGEKLLWTAKPDKRKALFRGIYLTLLGLLIFLAFLSAVFWSLDIQLKDLSTGIKLIPPAGDKLTALVFSIPLSALGLFMLFTAFFHMGFANNTFYALTNLRAISMRMKKGNITIYSSIPLNKTREIVWKDYANGIGTIFFMPIVEDNPDVPAQSAVEFRWVEGYVKAYDLANPLIFGEIKPSEEDTKDGTVEK